MSLTASSASPAAAIIGATPPSSASEVPDASSRAPSGRRTALVANMTTARTPAKPSEKATSPVRYGISQMPIT